MSVPFEAEVSTRRISSDGCRDEPRRVGPEPHIRSRRHRHRCAAGGPARRHRDGSEHVHRPHPRGHDRRERPVRRRGAAAGGPVHGAGRDLPGFATEVREGPAFNAGQNVVLNFSLKLSTVQETITVAGDAPVVQTTSAEVSSTIDRTAFENLPVKERNYFRLLTLDSNVVAPAPARTPSTSAARRSGTSAPTSTARTTTRSG